jgi:hypothetical protein
MMRLGKILDLLKFLLAFVAPAVILIIQVWRWETHLLGYLMVISVATTIGMFAARFRNWRFPLNLGEFITLVLPLMLWLLIALRFALLAPIFELQDEEMIVTGTEVCTGRRCGGCSYRATISRSWQETGNTVCPDKELTNTLHSGDTVMVNGIFTAHSSYFREMRKLSTSIQMDSIRQPR